MERSGPSIEMKVVLLVAAAVVIQDLVLVAMYVTGARPATIQIVLAAVLVLALVVAAVWGNAVSRAVRSLTRACYVARKGDTNVLSDLTRTDELGQLNKEINTVVERLRGLSVAEAQLTLARGAVAELEREAPEMARASHEILLSMKELREGSSAEIALLRKISGCIGEARSLMSDVISEPMGHPASSDAPARLASLHGLAKEIDLLADRVVDEVSRPAVDEASLARAINGLRDAARTMSQVATQAAGQLQRRSEDLASLRKATALVEAATDMKADGIRVAELMERSAAGGLNEATRLAALARRLGAAVQAYNARRMD